MTTKKKSKLPAPMNAKKPAGTMQPHTAPEVKDPKTLTIFALPGETAARVNR